MANKLNITTHSLNYEDIDISRHASKRIKERMGLHRKAQRRLLKNVMNRGLSHGQLKSRLHEWVTAALLQNSPNGTKGYIYANCLFLIHDYVLITVLDIPSNLLHETKVIFDSYKEKK